MKKTKIFYWIITGLTTLGLGIGSIFDLISAPEAVEHVISVILLISFRFLEQPNY